MAAEVGVRVTPPPPRRVVALIGESETNHPSVVSQQQLRATAGNPI